MSEKLLFNKSTIKVLDVFKAMKGKSLKGCTNGELAQLTGETPANVTRSLNTLIQAGLVEKNPEDGRFRYSSLMTNIATAHALEIDTATQRLIEIKQRTIAGARGILND